MICHVPPPQHGPPDIDAMRAYEGYWPRLRLMTMSAATPRLLPDFTEGPLGMRLRSLMKV